MRRDIGRVIGIGALGVLGACAVVPAMGQGEPRSLLEYAGEKPAPVMMPAGVRSTDASLLEGKPLAMFAPFIGDWEITDTWSDGTALWARNEYRVLMDGAFVDALTWAKDGDGEPYLRYYTVFAWDAANGKLITHGFQTDGSASVHDLGRAGDGADAGFTSEWGSYPARIRQQVDMPEDGTYRWRVWMIPAEGAEPRAMMDGHWMRRERPARGTTPVKSPD
jgi:hypothetical protein